jgi:hypothetical protein
MGKADWRDITATQQSILKDVYETDDLSSVPQMWAMYKEVGEYYQHGVSPRSTWKTELTMCSSKYLTTSQSYSPTTIMEIWSLFRILRKHIQLVRECTIMSIVS